MHVMGPHVMGPHVMHMIYHYSFNRSRLVDVVCMLFTTQWRLQYQLSKASPRCEYLSENSILYYPE